MKDKIESTVTFLLASKLQAEIREDYEAAKDINEAIGILRQPHEQYFALSEIQQLQTQVHKITGDGEVMMLFNKLLGVSAG